MDEPGPVHGGERFGEAGGERAHRLLGERARPADGLGEGQPGHVGGGKPGALGRRVGVDDRGRVRAADSPSGLHLVAEPVPELRVVGEFGSDDLHRHGAAGR